MYVNENPSRQTTDIWDSYENSNTKNSSIDGLKMLINNRISKIARIRSKKRFIIIIKKIISQCRRLE